MGQEAKYFIYYAFETQIDLSSHSPNQPKYMQLHKSWNEHVKFKIYTAKWLNKNKNKNQDPWKAGVIRSMFHTIPTLPRQQSHASCNPTTGQQVIKLPNHKVRRYRTLSDCLSNAKTHSVLPDINAHNVASFSHNDHTMRPNPICYHIVT